MATQKHDRNPGATIGGALACAYLLELRPAVDHNVAFIRPTKLYYLAHVFSERA
jgi:hypothetical protein